VNTRLPGQSDEREAGRSFGQGQVDPRRVARERPDQDAEGGRWRGERGRCWGQGGAETAVGAGAAAAIGVVMVNCRRMPVGGLIGRRMAVAVGACRVVRHRRHGVCGWLDRCMRTGQHGRRRDCLEWQRQQHQPHEQGTDERFHAPILAWRWHNSCVGTPMISLLQLSCAASIKA